MSPTDAGAALAADGVDFIDEDDAGSVFLGLHKQVTDAACTHANEHFHEIRTGNREERHACLPGYGAGEKGFAGSGRTEEQDTLGDFGAQGFEFSGVLEEFDDFSEFLLGFVGAGNFFEGHLLFVRAIKLGSALAEVHRLITLALSLAHHEVEEGNNQRDWADRNE